MYRCICNFAVVHVHRAFGPTRSCRYETALLARSRTHLAFRPPPSTTTCLHTALPAHSYDELDNGDKLRRLVTVLDRWKRSSESGHCFSSWTCPSTRRQPSANDNSLRRWGDDEQRSRVVLGGSGMAGEVLVALQRYLFVVDKGAYPDHFHGPKLFRTNFFDDAASPTAPAHLLDVCKHRLHPAPSSVPPWRDSENLPYLLLTPAVHRP